MNNKNTGDGELDGLIQELGDICHEHYLGCSQNKGAPDGYEYAYDNEVINLLDAPDVKTAIKKYAAQEANKAQQKLLQELMEQKQKYYQQVAGQPYATNGFKGSSNIYYKSGYKAIPLEVIQNKLEGLS